MKTFFIDYHSLTRMPLFCILAVLFLGISIVVPRNARSSSQNSVLERIEHSHKTVANNSDQEVQPITMETVQARERYQGGIFRVLARKKEIERFPCNSCHNESKVTVKKGAQLTHGDITLSHGQPGSLTCIDCHSEDNRNFLEDKKGNNIDFDHSYQLCGQCHFRQKSDWLGGAHGKRVQYWAGERVIYNCASCHNPHSPRFEKRFPATYSPSSP